MPAYTTFLHILLLSYSLASDPYQGFPEAVLYGSLWKSSYVFGLLLMPTLLIWIYTIFVAQWHFNSVMKEPEKCISINGTPNFSKDRLFALQTIVFILVMKYYSENAIQVL